MADSIVQTVTNVRIRWEEQMLSPSAFRSKDAKRESDKLEDAGMRLDFRSPFAHDTDRIINSHSYARYIDKTQVFFLIKNDHLTRRALHVQLVSRIARTIGRALMLNEDLIEAISVGHDIGHTPFGHAGESVLAKILQERSEGTFVHNAQSVRVLQELEHKGKGCDLTLPVLDGILCHNGEVAKRCFEREDQKSLSWENLKSNLHTCFIEKGADKRLRPATMEGCVVKVSDMIAYLGRDFEDAVMLGVVARSSLPLEVRRVLGTSNREIVNVLCSDLIENSYNQEALMFSERIFNAFNKMKAFNDEKIYTHSFIQDQKIKFERMLRRLFDIYLEDLQEGRTEMSIFQDYLNNLPDAYIKKTSNSRIVVDFIASMTDQYFLRQYEYRCLPNKIDYGSDFRTMKDVNVIVG